MQPTERWWIDLGALEARHPVLHAQTRLQDMAVEGRLATGGDIILPRALLDDLALLLDYLGTIPVTDVPIPTFEAFGRVRRAASSEEARLGWGDWNRPTTETNPDA